MRERKIAVIDMGTNTFHMLIALVAGHSHKTLFKEKIPVRIGKDGISKGQIVPQAIERALNALRYFKETADQYQVEEVHATATSAIRNAKNGRDLTRQIKEETGIGVRIIDGLQEAEYIYYGVTQAMDLGTNTSLIMDIGGGSVEFVLGNATKAFWKYSFEIGAQRLLDMFQQNDPITPTEMNALEAFLNKELTALDEGLKQFPPTAFVGSSGTFDTLSDIYRLKEGLPKDESATSFSVPVAAYKGIHEQFITKNREERLQIAGMVPMRVDMIVVASCLLNYILKKTAVNSIYVSTYALKEGLLYSILHAVQQDKNS